jgi:hypothetical protein
MESSLLEQNDDAFFITVKQPSYKLYVPFKTESKGFLELFVEPL